MTRVDATQAGVDATQADERRPRGHARRWCGAVFAAAMLAVLGGCASGAPTLNPVTWFHNLEGGEIAKKRPPPPGESEPYPNLATVPNTAPAISPALRQQIENGLVADRTSARELAAASPLPDPSSPAASPALFGQGSLPPPPSPDQGAAATASLNAASAPPPPVPSQANPLTTSAAPAAVKTAQLAPAASPPVSLPVPAPTSAPPDNPATLPALPTGPPAAVKLPGVPPAPNSSLRRAQAVSPARLPVIHAKAVSPQSPPAMALVFPPGSAILPADAVARLQSLAARRGVDVLAVTGYGDATSDDPGQQSAALALGLSRAQAVAATLTGAGVPPAGVRVDAEARGKGAVVRLME